MKDERNKGGREEKAQVVGMLREKMSREWTAPRPQVAASWIEEVEADGWSRHHHCSCHEH